MKFSQKELKSYITEQITKFAKTNNWNLSEVVINDITEKTFFILSESNFEEINPEEHIQNKKVIEPENDPKETIISVKHLSEELKRMKQLVDFRSPLLIRDSE